MRIAVAKPGIARNQTAFEAMAESYRYVAQRHGAKAIIFSDVEHRYVTFCISVKEIKALPLTICLGTLPSNSTEP